MDDRNDRVFRELASRYAEETGRRLNEERAAIEAQNPPRSLTLERKVRETVYGKRSPRRRRQIGLLAALAACLVLVLLVPGVLDLTRSHDAGSAPAADGAAEGGAGAPDGEAGEAPAPGLPSPGDAADAEAPGPAYERIELSFTLPTYLSVRDVEQDNEKTVYYLDNARLDDVVLTVEQFQQPLDHSDMTEYRINGQPAWSRSEPEYHLLTFESGGIVYVLTCRHELNTLLDLAGYIL